MRLTVSKTIIGLSLFSLLIQIVGGYTIIKQLDKPLNFSVIALAIVAELAAFGVLAPFMRYFYKIQKIALTKPETQQLIFASEGYSRLIPFGDYIAQRYYFSKRGLPKGPIVNYIVVLYSFGLASLVALFIGCQLAASLLYPNQITDSFIGKFAYIPLALTVVMAIIFVIQKRPSVRQRIQATFKRYFGQALGSPFTILQTANLNRRKITLLLIPLLITWPLEGLAYTLCLMAFGVEAPVLLCMYVYSFVKMFRFIPIFPGGVGEIETVSTLLFASYGYAVAPVLGGAILFRLISYWLPVVIGATAYPILLRRAKLLR